MRSKVRTEMEIRVSDNNVDWIERERLFLHALRASQAKIRDLNSDDTKKEVEIITEIIPRANWKWHPVLASARVHKKGRE
jgi:hypothetical protein